MVRKVAASSISQFAINALVTNPGFLEAANNVPLLDNGAGLLNHLLIRAPNSA
jgi:hypothetical protein